MEYIKEVGQFEVVGVEYWTGGVMGEKNSPYVELGLIVVKDSVNYLVQWRSWLTTGAAERTVNAIFELGFTGNGPEDFTSGRKDLFNVPKGVTVTVVSEEYKGKSYFKGSFINKASTKKEAGDIAKVLNEAGFNMYKMRYKQKNPPVYNSSESETIPF